MDLPPAAPPEPKKSLFEQVGVALPVALTALATAFAGMSTGELQKALIWRSTAAQDQAKATSQWTLAGFKRDRALTCQVAAAQLRAAAGSAADPFAGSPAGSPAADWLAGHGPPAARLPEVGDAALLELMAAVRDRRPEAELAPVAGRVTPAAVDAAIAAAEHTVDQTDRDWDATVKEAARLAAAAPPAGQAAGFRLEERRYRAESALNQGVGFLYEARVRVSGAASDRHQAKSQKFFIAMLAAQVGATVGALALARKKMSVLWLVAGGTGLLALVIGGTVYLAAG